MTNESSTRESSLINKGSRRHEAHTTVLIMKSASRKRTEATDTEPSCVDSVTISPHLTVEQQSRFTDLINSRPENFSTGQTDVGHVTRVKHEIQLTNDTPFKERHCRIPHGMCEQVREHLQHLLDSGIIRPSHSPWSSNVVWVKQKDGVDYRLLNARTIKGSYALPRIEELLDALAGSKHFTVLDLKSGYHQVEITEEHKERTAFSVAPLEFYVYNRIAMGLANAPATYQRLIEECLGDLHLQICLLAVKMAERKVDFENSLSKPMGS
ncbi:hypothetical protein C0Q70_05024 [Pomacea canaliculata]|uniref:Reverse transcriptase domain-containing protein n=1 Tax=Pomacea canaliculata TaxID=400727 RepID=A0A2T7PK41_POMCA|nr:hypothetical protein C0Q70_05024 [Pomacea canaliculata]